MVTSTTPPAELAIGPDLRLSIRQRDLLAWLETRRRPGRPDLWRTMTDYYDTTTPSPGVRTSTRTALVGLHGAGLIELSWSPAFAPITSLPDRLTQENLLLVRGRLDAEDRWLAETTRRRAVTQQLRLRAAIGRGDEPLAREAVDRLCGFWGLERPLPRVGISAPTRTRDFWRCARALAGRSLPPFQPWPHVPPARAGRPPAHHAAG